jgi:hypothetical protein
MTEETPFVPPLSRSATRLVRRQSSRCSPPSFAEDDVDATIDLPAGLVRPGRIELAA